MPLYTLPPEIVTHIFQWLGSAFFREDVSRLQVSRLWHALARPVFLQDLEFTASSLQRFIQVARTRPGFLGSVRPLVHSVTVSLEGFDNWGSRRLAPEPSGLNLDFVNDWTTELSKNLQASQAVFSKCRRLRSMTLTAWQEKYDGRLGIPRRSYLDAKATMAAVCLANITSLDLDLGGTNLLREWPSGGFHHCDVLRSRPVALRRLRLRAMIICSDILRVPVPGKDSEALEDVVINLSLSNMSEFDTSYRYATRCQHIPGGFSQLRDDMETQAIALAQALDNPKLIRVVSHTFPGLEMQSFDALTGKRMVLSAPAPWDAEGEVKQCCD